MSTAIRDENWLLSVDETNRCTSIYQTRSGHGADDRYPIASVILETENKLARKDDEIRARMIVKAPYMLRLLEQAIQALQPETYVAHEAIRDQFSDLTKEIEGT